MDGTSGKTLRVSTRSGQSHTSRIGSHTWLPPNDHKYHFPLDDLGLADEVIAIGKRKRFLEGCLGIPPNHRIPATVHFGGPVGAPITLVGRVAVML